MKHIMMWSGGKDSAMALHQLQNKGVTIDTLVTTVNVAHNRISMHGVRRELLEQQATAMGIQLKTVEVPETPTMTEYEDALTLSINELSRTGYTTAVFGDIFLEDLRSYREQQMAGLQVNCSFPLWKRNTRELIYEFIDADFKAIVICTNDNVLDQSFCGRLLDEEFIKDLPANVDPCGENGEYHTFVYDGPIFNSPVKFTKGEKVHKEYAAPAQSDDTNEKSTVGFHFCDLLPV